MPKENSGGHHDWLSRDYMDVDCAAIGCKYNIEAKCAVPILCKIKSDGGCAGFEAKPMSKVIDGD